jgi:hypothetical protein
MLSIILYFQLFLRSSQKLERRENNVIGEKDEQKCGRTHSTGRFSIPPTISEDHQSRKILDNTASHSKSLNSAELPSTPSLLEMGENVNRENTKRERRGKMRRERK